MPDQPTKVVGRRVGAFVIDTLVASVVVVLLWILFTDRLDADTTTGGGFVIGDTRYGFHEDSGGKRGAWGILSLLTWLAVFVVIPGLRGTSPGRALTGIRLVKGDGTHPGVGRAFVRYVVWVVDSFPYFLPLLGFILILTTKGNRRLGDMAAGTFTVRADAAGRPVDAAQPGPGVGYSHVPPPQYVGPSPGAPPGQGQGWPQQGQPQQPPPPPGYGGPPPPPQQPPPPPPPPPPGH